MDTVMELPNKKILIQVKESPIHTEVKLICKNCQKLYKNFEKNKSKTKSKSKSKNKENQ